MAQGGPTRGPPPGRLGVGLLTVRGGGHHTHAGAVRTRPASAERANVGQKATVGKASETPRELPVQLPASTCSCQAGRAVSGPGEHPPGTKPRTRVGGSRVSALEAAQRHAGQRGFVDPGGRGDALGFDGAQASKDALSLLVDRGGAVEEPEGHCELAEGGPEPGAQRVEPTVERLSGHRSDPDGQSPSPGHDVQAAGVCCGLATSAPASRAAARSARALRLPRRS